ncbi:MAG: acetoin utilization deacetylase AcuC-like enzyme [Verrucomicrobiales bacterium]|jgi:acetoin utilization deacetylase AcuC-like enzyme
MATGLLLDPLYQKHDPGRGHPESTLRLAAVTKALTESGLVEGTTSIDLRAATDEELALAHDEKYVQLAKAEIAAGIRMLSTGDTNVMADTLEVALAAAGGVMNAVDAVFTGEVDNAFCAVRPPGHHATPNRGMGFCVFNNVAVAARYAQKKHGVERVAIVDWDVHHGNGTQDIFYADPSVFFFSTHQSPLYPGTGAKNETGTGKGEGTVLNAPFPAGTGMADVQSAFVDGFLKSMKEFKPDLVLISAGFDSRIDDPLGDFQLTDPNFQELTKLILGLAEETAENRLVSVLEGGYNLDGLGKAVTAHVETLLG